MKLKSWLQALGVSLLLTTTSYAWYGHQHYHGNYGPGYYGWGGGYYGGGFGGPNIIINVPVAPVAPVVPVQPYVRQCERIQVCDPNQDICWFERYCD